MMNYEMFKEVVVENFKSFMPKKYANFKLEIHSVTKVNRTMDSINLIPSGEERRTVSPSIYINQLYEHYKACNDLNEVLQSAADVMIQGFMKTPEQAANLDFAKAKENIVMVLVNTEQNQNMLAHTPHRDFQDLSIIYRWVVAQGEDGISSTIINEDLAEHLGLNEERLYLTAVENTKNIFPPTIRSMNEVILNIMRDEGVPEEFAEMMSNEMPKDEAMYVISNKQGINGAASMLYENQLHMLAEIVESDLYILPSSIHEVIAVSTNMGDPNNLAEMVNEINMSQVSLDERLSNQVYHYDKDLRKLTMATDSPNKRLDGIVAELDAMCKGFVEKSR